MQPSPRAEEWAQGNKGPRAQGLEGYAGIGAREGDEGMRTRADAWTILGPWLPWALGSQRSLAPGARVRVPPSADDPETDELLGLA
jgi:hypothetical protein